jgi:hypothetical protein
MPSVPRVPEARPPIWNTPRYVSWQDAAQGRKIWKGQAAIRSGRLGAPIMDPRGNGWTRGDIMPTLGNHLAGGSDNGKGSIR